MNTKTVSPARRIVLAALFLALAFLLPMVTGHVPQVGNMLCPMHFPILLCGFVLGGPWGLAVGFVAPLLRSVLFGMPPMFPIAVSMAFELAAYGLVSGLVWRRVKHTLPMMYAALVTAMVAGRLVWGAVRFVLAGLTGSSFPFSAFLSGALLTAVPGILAQLVLIPMACSLFGISNDVAMQMVGVGFIIGVVQDSVETALNSAGDVEFAATAEYHQWLKQGKPLPEFLSGKKN